MLLHADLVAAIFCQVPGVAIQPSLLLIHDKLLQLLDACLLL
jgi:hypothetical protein